jgi:hypothetical protein
VQQTVIAPLRPDKTRVMVRATRPPPTARADHLDRRAGYRLFGARAAVGRGQRANSGANSGVKAGVKAGVNCLHVAVLTGFRPVMTHT